MLPGVRRITRLAPMLGRAYAILGTAVMRKILDGSCNELKDLGPAVYLASLLHIGDLLKQHSEAVLEPWAVAGLHEGEYAALCVRRNTPPTKMIQDRLQV